jgi:hypothetical protein
VCIIGCLFATSDQLPEVSEVDLCLLRRVFAERSASPAVHVHSPNIEGTIYVPSPRRPSPHHERSIPKTCFSSHSCHQSLSCDHGGLPLDAPGLAYSRSLLIIILIAHLAYNSHRYQVNCLDVDMICSALPGTSYLYRYLTSIRRLLSIVP